MYIFIQSFIFFIYLLIYLFVICFIILSSFPASILIHSFVILFIHSYFFPVLPIFFIHSVLYSLWFIYHAFCLSHLHTSVVKCFCDFRLLPWQGGRPASPPPTDTGLEKIIDLFVHTLIQAYFEEKYFFPF